MTNKNICIFGGTGFVGRHLANRLTDAGYTLRIPTRRRERNRDFLVNPRVQLIEADIREPAVMRELIADCTAVINLVGILNETGSATFEQAHVKLTERIVDAMAATGVRRLLHMSALNADSREENSQYLRSKGVGEDIAHAASTNGLSVTSFRPSVIFGPGDSFFNRFATLLRLTPMVFPLACANSRFAPVYVGDVVESMTRALTDPQTIGKHYDLCGPQSYSLAELVEYTAEQIGLQRRIWRLSKTLSWWQARMLEFVPGKPFSRDNFWSLQKESLCEQNALDELGITPTAIESVVPGYLAQRTNRGRYKRLRQHAHRS